MKNILKILTQLGITKEEIDEANVRKQYEKIARKLQTIFTRSLIEHSTKSVITMDPKVCKLMHELRNINNREVINFQVIQEDTDIYPKAVDDLANSFADIITEDIGVENLRGASEDLSIARSLIGKYEGTENEGFAIYISSTTPDIYDFNSRMVRKIAEDTKEELSEEELKKRMALEFGLEYLSTLSDVEFMNLLVAKGLITEESKKLLTRTYKEIGRERLQKEQYLHKEWQRIAKAQEIDTAKMDISRNKKKQDNKERD